MLCTMYSALEEGAAGAVGGVDGAGFEGAGRASDDSPAFADDRAAGSDADAEAATSVAGLT